MRDLRDMTKMELRDGNRKEIDNGSNKATSSKYGHRGGGSRNAYSVYSSIRGFATWESKTFSRSKLYSSEQNIQFNTGAQLFTRNGYDHKACRNNTKYPVSGYYLLDLYPSCGYLIPHNNTPTLNQTSESSKDLRDLRDIAKMELRDEKYTRCDNQPKELSSVGSRRERISNRLYPEVCRCQKRKSKTFSGSKWHSSVNNLQSNTQCRTIARNGSHHSSCRRNSKNLKFKYLNLDKYLIFKYIPHNNTPTLNQNMAASLCAHAV
ncbi:hypothetical protein LEP1GSC112_0423 [Leptospira interrogans serovar Pomona str. UT364]|nr:hypothetical protein LEP1GSC110_3591 [Leptospira interrogans serovar Medanensis str. UT053]EMO00873.1 hypothetical protein LEP1GSC112_0423 [Leptospira interrogans serovar Pomona str. UT364]